MNDVERWHRVKTLFFEALDRRSADRVSFLEKACAGDAVLLADVEAMIKAHEEADEDFMATPAGIDLVSQGGAPLIPTAAALASEAEPDAGLPPDPRVGPYRLVRALGRGGMGKVYLARRADGHFQHQVALKVVRGGLDTDDILARFRYERQILAALDHPHIAHLLDGGVTDDGRPYFAMEYVEGVPITTYCDTHRLSMTARLALFRTVCGAVQYAHQNLVVHRDLKPSNILVTDDPGSGPGQAQVKLLDFGIAKVLREEGLDLSIPQTRTGLRLMTPEYAAPEQVRGEAITTATDVYQLGVLLYELLTGRRPYRAEQRVRWAIEQAILEEEPTRPSTAVREAAATRQADAESISMARATRLADLARLLSGDLDTICLKALQKVPERRYPTVGHFSEDIRLHLEGLPVKARPDALTYRASKFIRRHWMVVATAAFMVLLLLSGVATTAWQARIAQRQRLKAEQRFADLRHLARSVLFELHDAIAALPGSTEARELLVLRSLEYLDKLAQDGAADTTLSLELAAAYRRVGDVQGNPTNANLGQTQHALASYRKGLRIAQGAVTAHPGNAEARAALGLILERLSDVQAASGTLEAADSSLRAAVDLYHAVARDRSDDARYWTQYAVGLIKRGDLLGNHNFANRGDTLGALAQYQAAQPILDSLYTADSSRTNVFRLRGLIHERIGTIYEMRGDVDAALAAYRASLDVREAYAAAHTDNVDAIRDLAVAHEKMGMMSVAAGDLDEALHRFQQAKAIFEGLWQADPKNVQACLSLAISLYHLGNLAGWPDQPNRNRPAEARRHYRQALAFVEDLYAADAANTRLAFWRTELQERLRRLGAP